MLVGTMYISVILMASPHCIFGEMESENSCKRYLPVFLVHGLFGASVNLDLLVQWIKEEHPGTIVFNSNAYPRLASLTPMLEQLNGKLGEQFRRFSNQNKDGFVALGYSQGADLCRALVELNPDHNVHTLIMLAGSTAGQYGIPTFVAQLEPFANNPFSLNDATDYFYTQNAQHHVSVANYWRDPYRLQEYYREVSFLPDIDCDIYSRRCDDYKAAFEKLEVLIAIAGKDDGIVIPYQSCYFDFYRDNSTVVESFRNRKIYTENTFGLRTIDTEKTYKRFEMDGVEHFEWPFNREVFEKFILPYLPSIEVPCDS